MLEKIHFSICMCCSCMQLCNHLSKNICLMILSEKLYLFRFVLVPLKAGYIYYSSSYRCVAWVEGRSVVWSEEIFLLPVIAFTVAMITTCIICDLGDRLLQYFAGISSQSATYASQGAHKRLRSSFSLHESKGGHKETFMSISSFIFVN